MRLTKTAVDAAKYPHPTASKRRHVLWDDDVAGFGLRVYPSGRRAFVFRFELAGRQRWMTLGDYGALTVQQARKRALKARAQVFDGVNPADAVRKQRERGKTFAELAEEWLNAVAATIKPRTLHDYRLYVRFLTPAFGTRPVASITEADVRRWYTKMADKPVQANRRLHVLSRILEEAEHRGLRAGSNPCTRIKRYREMARTRFLSPAELARVGDAIHQLETEGITFKGDARPKKISKAAAAAIRLLLFTGARVGEVLSMRWEHIDLQRGVWALPDAKAGARVVFLPAPALEVLASLPHAGEWVIPGARNGRPMVNLSKPWLRVRRAANVKDVRLHDLRHSHGAVSASGGDSLLIVGALLGHRRAASTERYAHLADSAVKAASERTAATIAAALSGESGDVVELRRPSKQKGTR